MYKKEILQSNNKNETKSKKNKKFTILFLNLFLEKGEGREKERESNTNVRLPLVRPELGTWPTAQACAPIRNQSRDFSVHRQHSVH